MIKKLDTIVEGGVFKPLQPLTLPESRRVTLTVAVADDDDDWMDVEFMDAWGVGARDFELTACPTREPFHAKVTVSRSSVKGQDT